MFGRGPGARVLRSLDHHEAGRGYQPSSQESFDTGFVQRGPGALQLPWREHLHVEGIVNRIDLAVDPSEAEGLLNGVVVGQ